ncbi:DNA-directed RNA polymerase III subunit RPC5 [Gossypium arboreum]|uniref:DNA-directed RNA polymerase III subunit RPC5 n=1 Tax=Gossypium arboreum TaxID=29729 RepID=A0A0B0MVJ5_GOSAR|nr:DNA-directed RNA polymerase III subunit RPC5 [Gossypium arboreum]
MAAVETPTENPAPASGDGDGASLTCAEETVRIAITKANKKAFNMLTWAISRREEKLKILGFFF